MSLHMVLLHNANALDGYHLFSYRQVPQASVTVFTGRSLDVNANRDNFFGSQTCRRLAGTGVF